MQFSASRYLKSSPSVCVCMCVSVCMCMYAVCVQLWLSALIFCRRSRIGDLFGKVSSPKLHSQYGKAREADGHYQEKAKAYEAAREFDSAIRYVYVYMY